MDRPASGSTLAAARPMETNTRFTVDLDHCQRAADEMYAILSARERAVVERWSSFPGPTAVKVARWVGIAAALIGLLLHPSFRLDLFFAALLPIFFFQPRWNAAFLAWLLRWVDGRARHLANRLVREARRLAPFEADFDLKGDVLTYRRAKEGEWRNAWRRKLGKFRARGVATQADSVTVIFSRSSSPMPAVVILQQGREWTTQVLEAVNVTLRRH